MNKIGLLVLIAQTFSFASLSQSGRFVYADTFNTSGVSPVPSHYIKQHGIKRVEMYHMAKDRKDSSLFKTFLYDTAGNLIKVLMHGRGKIGVVSVDSLIYDAKNRLAALYLKSNEGIIQQSVFHYFGDSLIRSNVYSVLTFENKIDTSYCYAYFDEQRKLLNTNWLDSKKKVKKMFTYTYTEQGLPAEMKCVDLSGEGMNYGYRYEHVFSSHGRQMILWDIYSKNRIKRSECFYNDKNQCIKCVDYTPRNDFAARFSYLPDGGVFEYFQEYTDLFNKKFISIPSRYHYYQ